ncbi:Transposase, partial [Dysosmobacter welbionis]
MRHPLHYPKIVRSPPRFFYFPLFPCSLPLPKFAFLLPLNLPYYIPLLP